MECGVSEKSKKRKEDLKWTMQKKKKIEEDNRMGKTRDLFKKVEDIKGTFHARMGWVQKRTEMVKI